MAIRTEDIKKVTKKRRPPADAGGSKTISNYTYVEDDGGEHFYPIQTYSPIMCETVELFYTFTPAEGIKQLFWQRDDKEAVETVSKLKYILNKEGYKWSFKSKYFGTFKREDYLEYLRQEAETFDRYSATQETKRDKLTRYTYQEIKPEKNGSFRKLLNALALKRDTIDPLRSQYRMAAGLLSAFLPREFDGEKPLFTVVADVKSSGKSYVVRACTKLVQGILPIELRAEAQHDKEAVGSNQQMANKYALFDNITVMKANERALLTHYITDKDIKKWIMHKSHGRYANNKTYFSTLNRWFTLDDDAQERVLVIWMTPRNRTNQEERKNAVQIIGELGKKETNYIRKDILAHLEEINYSKIVGHQAHQKFEEWARIMAQMLRQFYTENEVGVFDFSPSNEEIEFDTDVLYIGDLIGQLFIQRRLKKDRYEPVPEHIKISCQRMWERYRDAYPEDYYAKGHQKRLTEKRRAISGKIAKTRNCHLDYVRIKEESTGRQVRHFVITRGKKFKYVYDRDDMHRVLEEIGLKSQKERNVVMKVLNTIVLNRGNLEEKVTKLLKKLKLYTFENAMYMTEAFEEQPVGNEISPSIETSDTSNSIWYEELRELTEMTD